MKRQSLQAGVPFVSRRELAVRALGEATPEEDSLAEARLKAAATLELARALHHLRRTKSGRHVLSLPLPTTKVKGTMANLSKRGARVAKIRGDLLRHLDAGDLDTHERRYTYGKLAQIELNPLTRAYYQTRARIGIDMSNTDTPSELTESSDGISDDGAFDQQIIGACRCDSVSGLADIAIGSGLRQHLNIHNGVAGSGGVEHLMVSGGLQHLMVSGRIPSYLFTRANLSNPIFRRRLSSALKAMTPKMRRRASARIVAAFHSLPNNWQNLSVNGAVRNVYPSVAGFRGGYPSVSGGWSGVSVSGRRSSCPYANVAGAFTP